MAHAFITHIQVHVNIDFLKQFGYTMDQLLEKIAKSTKKLRFFREFNTVYRSKKRIWAILKVKKILDEIFSMGSKLWKTCLGSLKNIVGCLDTILTWLGALKMKVKKYSV